MIDQLREERVQQTEKHFLLTHLITASPAGILILDVENRISLANPAAATILQTDLSQLAGSKMAELGSYLSLQLEAIKAGESKIIQVHGMQIYRAYKAKFVDRGFVNHFIVIEELTGEIREIERKSYEKVIRMMSHEINNSTGAVNSLLDLVLSYQQQLSTVDQEDYKQAIQVAIERNRHLNQFMTNFAKVVRVPPPVKERYNVHTLLQTIYTLLFANLKKHGIAWEWQLASEPLMIEIDVQQMEQVLLNVVKNAIEAIGEKGTITARTCRKPMQLVISDTGKGFTQESKKLLFSPFFSTKKTGQGIGLTLTREILSNHGFDFSLETRHQQTYFTINFDGKTPVSANSLSALQAKAKE
jgi:nitrogen fixation/metabolism regulation signal transduction histidine kinase